MKYLFKIGSCGFELLSDRIIPIQDNERCFLVDKVKVDYRISLTSIQTPEFEKEKLIYKDENVIITKNEYDYMKRYHRLIHLNLIYGVSSLKGRKIDSYYFEDSHFIENPSFSIWNFFHLEQIFIDNKGIILHSSFICDNGKAILFTAPSGTGKSTQAELWKKVRGSEIINGDRCLLQCNNKQWYANGFPFHGSSEYCQNQTIPIKSIIILRQGNENRVVSLTDAQKVKLLFSEIIYNSWDPYFIEKAMDMVVELVKVIPVYQYYCNMNDDAVTYLEEVIRS